MPSMQVAGHVPGPVRVRVRRVYGGRDPGDGARVLVDRLWPRGLSKATADLDEWCKQVAPSTALRKWFGHDPDLAEQFAERYRAELDSPDGAAAVSHLRDLARTGPLTLLTATRDPNVSHALVLADLLNG